MADFVKAARTTEIEPGQARRVEVNGKQIALLNIEGQFCAIDHTCPRGGRPWAGGELRGRGVPCPWHRGKFDVRTGEVVGAPPQRAVTRYGVRVTGTDIEVEA